MKRKNEIFQKLSNYENSIEGMKKFVEENKKTLSLVWISKKINKNIFDEIKLEDIEFLELLLLIKNKELEKIDEVFSHIEENIIIKKNNIDSNYGFYEIYLQYYNIINFFKGSYKDKEKYMIDIYYDNNLNSIKINKSRLEFLRKVYYEYKKYYRIFKNCFKENHKIFLKKFNIKNFFIFFNQLENLKNNELKENIVKSFQYVIIYYILNKLSIKNFSDDILKPNSFNNRDFNELLKLFNSQNLELFVKEIFYINKIKEIANFVNDQNIKNDHEIFNFLYDYYPNLLLVIFIKYYLEIV